ncbi:MAG: hypothetical protein JO022_21040 [Acidobacteriaceae bacterium]|nr:hypothetical protein [Acidobacteriaceae bacterium]
MQRLFEIVPPDRAPAAARVDVTKELNQLLRRLRQYRSETEWVDAVLDGAAQFAERAALFSFEDGKLQLRGRRNLEVSANLKFPVSERNAFAGAVSSRDVVIALRTPAEVGADLSTGDYKQRAYIVPIMNGERVVAALFAANDGQVDVNTLELISGVASIVLERHANTAQRVQIDMSAPARAANSEAEPVALPAWSRLNHAERMLHVRAQRFARVRVAEMQLASPEACRAAREQNNVYLFLKNEIDSAREAYRNQFMTSPTMIDYLHAELVRTAAEGDPSKLGAEYPGELG